MASNQSIRQRILSELGSSGLNRFPPQVLELAFRRVEREYAGQITESTNREKSVCRRRATGKRGQFHFFLRHYFGHYFGSPFGPQQKALIEDIQALRGRQRDPVKMTRALSRGFGKSTVLTLCGTLWLILTRTWNFPIIISSSLESAKGFLQAIIDECEDNAVLLEHYPELRPKKDQKGQTVSWKDGDIVFQGGARILAKGFLNSIRGKRRKESRPDALLIDDPDEEKDVASESTMVRKMRWLDRAALRLGGAWGLDVIVAYTTIAPNCVGEQIFTDNQKYGHWDRKKFKAIEVDEEGNEFSTWPQTWPLKALQEERAQDPIGFAQERQNEPLAEVDQRFKGLIQRYRFPPAPSWSDWTLALAVDLSLGKSEKSDYSAIIGVGLGPDGKFYEAYSDIQRRRPDAIERDLMLALQTLPWNICGIESNANQEYFLLNFRRLVSEFNKTSANKITIPIVELSNTSDKEARIMGALQPLVASGLLLLRDDSETLFQQLNEFPYRHKDGPDALEMGVRLIREMPGIRASKPKEQPNQNTARQVQERRKNTIQSRQYDSLLRKLGYDGPNDPRLRRD
ncbi:MAG: hypothetical protein CMN76_08660 [Spirochaetaceae bacterium]|nr:hypothetical protein [Spirochaetaceae bacterium]|tara:strand:+ start:67115 stop:68827 length:1713 start_codon:yes stop_codon:yes gene_type:complete